MAERMLILSTGTIEFRVPVASDQDLEHFKNQTGPFSGEWIRAQDPEGREVTLRRGAVVSALLADAD